MRVNYHRFTLGRTWGLGWRGKPCTVTPPPGEAIMVVLCLRALLIFQDSPKPR